MVISIWKGAFGMRKFLYGITALLLVFCAVLSLSSCNEKSEYETGVRLPSPTPAFYTTDIEGTPDAPVSKSDTVLSSDTTPTPTVTPTSSPTPKETPTPEPESSETTKPQNIKHPYYIRINRVQNCVTVYRTSSEGSCGEPYKAMVCSTGTDTPIGKFNTINKYEWRALFNDCYGQYATRIVGSILFHSVPYFTRDKSDLEYEEYNKLGTAASMGCIRLTCIDAKWIYDNCPIGTTVEIYDDESSPGPLGKPSAPFIDPESPKRGWDPTDPDPHNPWNK